MKKILIVDDSRMILEVAKNIILSSSLDVEVTTISNPLEAMDLMVKELFNVLILDIVMPSISGIDVLKQINEVPELESMNTIVFSSLTDSKALSECFKLGAYDYISKPLDTDEFLARINHAMHEHELSLALHDNIKILESKNTELEVLNIQLKEAQAQLIQRERLAGIGNLASGMAHEVNNPLGFISSNVTTLRDITTSMMGIYAMMKDVIAKDLESGQTWLEVVKEKEDSADLTGIMGDVGEIFDDIDTGVERIASIIDALQKFSSVENQDVFEDVDVNLTLGVALKLLDSKMSGGVEVLSHFNSTYLVNGNGADINMALFHIIKNSVEAINENKDVHGEIVIETKDAERDTLEITIKDNGCGMSDEVIHHALDPFYTTKKGGAFVGMGLTSAYNCLVKVMKGQISINSEGEGTTVTITLPAKKNGNEIRWK